MGLGKKFKRFAGKTGKVVEDVTGSRALGRATSIAVGAAGGALVGGGPGAIAGGIVGSSGYSSVSREETNKANSVLQAQQLKNIEAIKNEEIAQKQKQRLLLEADLQEQINQERKRTTFAGASIQGITERKKLLGV